MIKLLGAALIIASAASVGIRMAHSVKMEEANLRQILKVMELMRCEIQSRLTPTKELCEMASGICRGALREVFQATAQRIELQSDGDVGEIMEAVLIRHGQSLPISCICRLRELGGVLGAYEAEAQTKALEALSGRVSASVEEIRQGRAERCRSYEVMGVCAGCALAIILL